MTDEPEILTCSCCGSGIRDTPEENVHYGQIPYPDDTGLGMCKYCGGDPEADSLTDDGFKKKIGWATTTPRTHAPRLILDPCFHLVETVEGYRDKVYEATKRWTQLPKEALL